MQLRNFNKIIEAGPESLDPLEKSSILVLVFQMLGEAAIILFPGGKYSALKWYSWKRLAKLGLLMLRLVKMVYGKGK